VSDIPIAQYSSGANFPTQCSLVMWRKAPLTWAQDTLMIMMLHGDAAAGRPGHYNRPGDAAGRPSRAGMDR